SSRPTHHLRPGADGGIFEQLSPRTIAGLDAWQQKPRRFRVSLSTDHGTLVFGWGIQLFTVWGHGRIRAILTRPGQGAGCHVANGNHEPARRRGGHENARPAVRAWSSPRKPQSSGADPARKHGLSIIRTNGFDGRTHSTVPDSKISRRHGA